MRISASVNSMCIAQPRRPRARGARPRGGVGQLRTSATSTAEAEPETSTATAEPEGEEADPEALASQAAELEGFLKMLNESELGLTVRVLSRSSQLAASHCPSERLLCLHICTPALQEDGEGVSSSSSKRRKQSVSSGSRPKKRNSSSSFSSSSSKHKQAESNSSLNADSSSQANKRNTSGQAAAFPSTSEREQARQAAASRSERMAQTRSFGMSSASSAVNGKKRTGRGAKAKKSVEEDGLSFDEQPVTGQQQSHFSHYLAEVGKTALLDKSDELRLCKQIQALEKMESARDELANQLGRTPSESEWASAFGYESVQSFREHLDDCREAKNRMIRANIRLVVNLAQRYNTSNNLALSDLVQEGTMGLIKAAEKFDATRGFKFSSYAHWWIRQRLSSSREYINTIRVPNHALQLVGKLSQVQSDFEMENGRQPTNEEAAERLGVSASKVETLKRSGSGSVSLDQEFSDRDGDGNGALSEVTADPSVSEPAEEADDMLRSRSLRDVLNTLETRERDVIVLRYGLDDGRPRTLYNIGKRFAVTRERVRQIERNALRKLKSPSRSRTLTDHARWAGISPSDIIAATSVPPVDDF